MEIFVSYSHEDIEWRERVQVFLNILKQKYDSGFLAWSDVQIKVGARWEEEINAAIERSNLALLLISPDFLASDFIMREELEAIEEREITFYGVLVRPSPWSLFDRLSAVQLANVDQPLSTLRPHAVDRLLTDLVYDLDGRIQAFASAETSEEVTETANEVELASTEAHAPQERPRFDPGGYRFRTRAELSDLIWTTRGQRMTGALKIFQVRTQQTWIAVTDRSIFCILDSKRTFDGNRLIQWEIPSSPPPTVGTRRRANKSRTCLLDIGPKRNWLLSLSLFEESGPAGIQGQPPLKAAEMRVRDMLQGAGPVP